MTTMTESEKVLYTANFHTTGGRGKGKGTVTEQRLYQLIRQPQPIADRQFEIEILDSGVEVFSFTFG